MRFTYSPPLLPNPQHYHRYDATSQEDVPHRCEFLGVPRIPLGSQMTWNRVIVKLFETDMTSRIAVSVGQPTLAFVRDWPTRILVESTWLGV